MIKISFELSREMIEQIEALAMEIDFSAVDLPELAEQEHEGQFNYWRDTSLCHHLSDEQRKTKRFIAEYVRRMQ